MGSSYPPPPPGGYQPPPGYQAPPPGYPQQQGYAPQGYPPPGYPPPKKTSPLVWILVVVGIVFLIGILAVGGVVFYGLHRLRQAGVDPDLMRRNPALAAAKIAVKMNHDVDLLKIDEDRGTIVVRDKKTGKIMRANFDDAQHGHFSFSGDDGGTVDISGSKGTIDVKGPDGNMHFGGGAPTDVPSWVPQYPGSKPENAITSNTPTDAGGMFHFKTSDSSDAVLKFYSDHASGQGLKVTNTTSSHGTGGSGGLLTAEDTGTKRTLTIVVGAEGSESNVAVTYATKK